MNPFTKHPHAMGESYFKHLWHSLIFSSRMFIASVFCLIHGFLPFLFVFTTSGMLSKMTRAFVKRAPNDERFVGKTCECNGHAHSNGCKKEAIFEVTRNGKRLSVCGNCDLPADYDKVSLPERIDR